MELTPQEFQNLPLPYASVTKDQFSAFKVNFAKDNNISRILLQNDAMLLVKNGLQASDVERLRNLHRKLLRYRLRNKIERRNESK